MTPAAQLIADQGQLASDQQAQTQAQQDLAGATMTAPMSGVVGQVSLTKGSTASTSQGVTIVGSGAAAVSGTVTLAQMPKVALGDVVQVNPVGSATTLTGSVTTIGLLPVSSTSSTPTYPITVTIPSGADNLPGGDAAQLSIVTASVKNALTVPASAVVIQTAGNGTITVLSGGSTQTVNVSTGAVGGGSNDQNLWMVLGGVT